MYYCIPQLALPTGSSLLFFLSFLFIAKAQRCLDTQIFKNLLIKCPHWAVDGTQLMEGDDKIYIVKLIRKYFIYSSNNKEGSGLMPK
jgi:hypothetical protein